MDLLGNNLKTDLTYHCLAHTMDVVEACSRLAQAEKVSGDDLTLLLTAALLHDTGFLRTYQDHETASTEIASELLPEFGYTEDEIATINDLIRATRIPQTPTSRLGELLCDADLDYLGRYDYEQIAHNLYLEFRQYGIITTEEQWLDLQIRFLSGHRYFTGTSQQSRESGKQAQLERLRSLRH